MRERQGSKNSSKKKRPSRPAHKASPKGKSFTPAEERAARAARITVTNAPKFGWIAHSEADPEHRYRLYWDPADGKLKCPCPDYVFSIRRNPHFECKHCHAALLFIAREYLRTHCG